MKQTHIFLSEKKTQNQTNPHREIDKERNFGVTNTCEHQTHLSPEV